MKKIVILQSEKANKTNTYKKMKTKFFLFFAAMLICGSMTAQEPEPEPEPDHYYQLTTSSFESNMTFRAKVCIDGVEQQSINVIEIGAFNGTTVTDSKFVKTFNNYYRVNMTIGGGGSYEITFKLYDHANDEELLNYTLTDPDGNLCNTFTWSNDANYGSYANPYVLDFRHTFTKDITAYNPNSNPPDHYYLIASPIGTVSPEDVTNMTSNNFDLYYYDQTQDKEWINYEGSNGNFSLEPGKGYLYANSQDVTLTFKGAPYSSNGEVPLVYDAGVNQNTALIGWNLVGNPFAQPAYITDNRSFYRMNEYGTGLISESGAIAAMEGVFVKAADADDNNITFSTEQPSRSGEQLTVNLSQNRGAAIDRVIIGFSEGDVLPKFMLNENNAKLYIPQGNVDYAVVRSAGVGELPLNFKASKNGTYTLSIDTENMEMNYLHLIDNMTGMDIDLLQTPSYSFEASTRDYASRFRLVFAGTSTDATSNETFAFYSNGNWIINNPSTGSGVATLQIVDVNGHILCNEQINGCCNKSLNTAPGVYMLRLINSEYVKTQKIVVR